MFKNTTAGIIFQSFVTIPFLAVRLAFWVLAFTIRGARAAARWIIKAMDNLETLLPAWQAKAEEAATAFSLSAIHCACCLAGCLVEQIAAAWRFREEIILEGRAAA